MKSSQEIRKFVRATLNEGFQKSHQDSRVDTQQDLAKIKEYVDRKLNEFSNDVRRIALENNHPYINHYLAMAIYNLENTIANGESKLDGAEELYL